MPAEFGNSIQIQIQIHGKRKYKIEIGCNLSMSNFKGHLTAEYTLCVSHVKSFLHYHVPV